MSDHKTLFGAMAPLPIAKPYGLCAQAVARALARQFHEEGIREPIRFVFNTQQGADQDLAALWLWIQLASPGPWRELLSLAPRF